MNPIRSHLKEKLHCCIKVARVVCMFESNKSWHRGWFCLIKQWGVREPNLKIKWNQETHVSQRSKKHRWIGDFGVSWLSSLGGVNRTLVVKYEVRTKQVTMFCENKRNFWLMGVITNNVSNQTWTFVLGTNVRSICSTLKVIYNPIFSS